MKRAVISGLGFVALAAAPAMAADSRKGADRRTGGGAAVYNWNGFYIGGNIGGGWANAEFLNLANTTFFGDVAGPPAFSHNMSGFVGGGQIGYNFQSGAFVFGLEAMFNYSDIKGGVNPLRGGLPPLGQDDNFATRIQSLFLGTARSATPGTTCCSTPRAVTRPGR